MTNIIGDQIINYRNKKYNENEFFFDYLKKEIKDKRKMGHLTALIS
jgi:5-(carboxyamino)imidazole ribonucleotide synthase